MSKFKFTDSDWLNGLLSGYPRCCIIWFFLRKPFVPILSYFNSGMSTKQFYLEKALKPHRHTSHCECPIHSMVYWVQNAVPEWYTCKKCGWQQIGSVECRMCLYRRGTRR